MQDPTCRLDFGWGVGGQFQTAPALLSCSPAGPACTAVILGREALAQAVLHHDECKVQNRWHGVGRDGAWLPVRDQPHKQDWPEGFPVLMSGSHVKGWEGTTPDFHLDSFLIH